MPFLSEVIVFLLAMVVIVPLVRSLRLSPILGYLTVGILAGLSALGLVEYVEDMRAFAELGVVFLLLAVGLELSFERQRIFAQVGLTAAAISAVAFYWGNSAQMSPPNVIFSRSSVPAGQN